MARSPDIIEPGMTRAAALAHLRGAFAEAGLDSPALDARILVAQALGIGASELVTRPDAPLRPEGATRLAGFASRRLAREPVSRILGEAEFWGLPFRLSDATLAPRPDTETVVATALSMVGDRRNALRVLDLGTGSGCLLVALLHEWPNATGLGVDRSLDALMVARTNAVRNGVASRARFVAGDWAASVNGRFDLVVSNPPYIPSTALAGLDPEVREHDPLAALDGGHDGLGAYRVIIAQAGSLLKQGGRVVVEIGYDQEAAVRDLAQRLNFRVLPTARDLSGHPRAVALARS